MAKDAGDMIGSVLGTIVKEITENVTPDSNGNGNGHHLLHKDNGGGALSGARGVAAGAALAAAVPMAGMAAKKVAMKVGSPAAGAKKLAEKAGDKVSGGVKDAVSDKVDEVGGAPEIAKDAGKKMLPSLGKKMIPGLGGDDDSEGSEDSGDSKGKGQPGVGKGRRMPIQQEVDIAVPLSVAYNQWTQFEEWPQFMHRIDRATQEDDDTISFRTKIWGKSKEFVGQIEEQIPDERIKWTVKEGVAHTGVVTFHELAPKLTRVTVSIDVQPGSLVEKMARGMRHVKRAVRADMHRFKAFIEMEEEETGAWRGEIHDGEVAKRKSSSSGSSKSSSSSKPSGSSKSSSSSKSKSSGGGRSRSKKQSKPKSRKRGS